MLSPVSSFPYSQPFAASPRPLIDDEDTAGSTSTMAMRLACCFCRCLDWSISSPALRRLVNDLKSKHLYFLFNPSHVPTSRVWYTLFKVHRVLMKEGAPFESEYIPSNRTIGGMRLPYHLLWTKERHLYVLTMYNVKIGDRDGAYEVAFKIDTQQNVVPLVCVTPGSQTKQLSREAQLGKGVVSFHNSDTSSVGFPSFCLFYSIALPFDGLIECISSVSSSRFAQVRLELKNRVKTQALIITLKALSLFVDSVRELHEKGEVLGDIDASQLWIDGDPTTTPIGNVRGDIRGIKVLSGRAESLTTNSDVVQIGGVIVKVANSLTPLITSGVSICHRIEASRLSLDGPSESRMRKRREEKASGSGDENNALLSQYRDIHVELALMGAEFLTMSTTSDLEQLAPRLQKLAADLESEWRKIFLS